METTSGDVAYITVESGTSENMGIAVVISLIGLVADELGVILPTPRYQKRL